MSMFNNRFSHPQDESDFSHNGAKQDIPVQIDSVSYSNLVEDAEDIIDHWYDHFMTIQDEEELEDALYDFYNHVVSNTLKEVQIGEIEERIEILKNLEEEEEQDKY